jgi:hypothetical protein
MEIFITKLESHQHQHEVGNLQCNDGITTTSTQRWRYSGRGWHHNNISTKMEIFITRMASQQHQHEDGNLQHEDGIKTTSVRRWKTSTLGWHHNNINTKLEIFSTRMTSTLLPLSREFLSDYTNLNSKVLKLYRR